MDNVEQRARELLATEYRKDERHGMERAALDGTNDVLPAIRAIVAALASQAQTPAAAVPDATERRVIELLLALTYEAWNLADNTEDAGDTDLYVQRADFDNLSARLDELDELPDDQPGYTMEVAAKARWALRRLLAAAPAPGVDRG